MLKTIWAFGVVCALTFAATTTSPETAKKKTSKRPVHSAAKKSAGAHTTASSTAGETAAKPATGKSSAAASRSRTAKNTKARRVVRSYQQAPTPERYKEIQQALISKGYLQGEPTGQWGPDSADALRRFQVDQNLTADGKIGSLSLIALGLGPKRLTAQSNPQAPAGPPNPATQPNAASPANAPSPASPINPANPPK